MKEWYKEDKIPQKPIDEEIDPKGYLEYPTLVNPNVRGGKTVLGSVGGQSRQYTIGDDGMLTYGDGSDGSLTTSGNVNLTEDKYYTDLTISSGDTFNTNGYRVFVSGTLTIEGTLLRNGNDASGKTEGAVLADGYLKGSLIGKTGAGGGTGYTGAGGNGGAGGDGTNGSNTTNSIGKDGSNGSSGGSGGGSAGGWSGGSGGSGGTGGTVTASNVKLIANWHLMTLLDIASSGSTVKFDNSASSASSGGGGGGAARTSGGSVGTGGDGGDGGGSGSSGAIVAVYAKSIIIKSGGSITANGGSGGDGQNGGDGSWNEPGSSAGGGGGGAGGSGGDGGQIILVYNSLENKGTISVAGGNGGTGGSGGSGIGTDGGDGSDGSNGTDGTAGTIYYFEMSL